MSTFGSKTMWIRVAVIEVLLVLVAGSVYFFFGPKQLDIQSQKESQELSDKIAAVG